MADGSQKRKRKAAESTMNDQEVHISAERAKNSRAFPGRPQGIRAPHGAKVFEISWPDGSTHQLPHEILRGYCPCAGCQGHSGEITFQEGKNLELRDLKPVGNYALCLTWGDAHDTGIYSFEFLFRLACLQEQMGTIALIELERLPRAAIVMAGQG